MSRTSKIEVQRQRYDYLRKAPTPTQDDVDEEIAMLREAVASNWPGTGTMLARIAFLESL